MAKILVIFNPVCGIAVPWNYEKLVAQSCKDATVQYDLVYTQQESDAYLSALDLKRYARIIVIGGDGTIREVLSFCIHNSIDIPIGIVPAGTGNILAGALGIPIFPKAAISFALRAKPLTIHAGLVNKKHYFFVACGMGADADIVKHTHRSFKRRFGFLAYVYSFLRRLKLSEPYDFMVSIDGRQYAIKAHFVLCFAIFHSWFGRFHKKFTVPPGAFRLISCTTKTLWGIFSLFNPFKKSHSKCTFETGKHIVITSAETKQKRVYAQIDGELISEDLLEIEYVPRAVQVIAR